MRLSLRSVAAALAVSLLAVAAFASGNEEPSSGPDKGASLMLPIKPFNQHIDEYCVVCKAGNDPLVLAFVTRNDDATKALLARLSDAYKKGKDMHLNVAIVIVGSGEQADGLRRWVVDHKLPVPAAVLPSDNKGLQPWKINPNVSNTVVFMREKKVQAVAVNLKADGLQGRLDDVCKP
ncbi:MAG: hypothetical protein HYU66_20285 [Armatimonadetes bacterium]|nr:hypothetical protein [Armatimonadota bacterium]